MGESKLTTEEEAEINAEISKTRLLQEKITQRAKKIAFFGLYMLPLAIFILLMCGAKIGFVQNPTLVYWYDTVNGSQMITMTLIIFGYMLCMLTTAIISLVNYNNGNKTIKKLNELYNKLYPGRIVNQEKERKIQIEKMKKQMNQHFSIGMFFITILAVYLVFNGTYGIKIENDNVFLNYLTNICQNTIIHEVLAVLISVNAVLLIMRYIQFKKLEKEQAKNASPAEIPGTDIQ